MNIIKKNLIRALAVVGLVASVPAASAATTFNFSYFGTGSPENTALGSQLSLVVNSISGGWDFTVSNASPWVSADDPVSSNIAEIYFFSPKAAGSSYGSSFSIFNDSGAGVDMTTPTAIPGHLPGAQKGDYAWSFAADDGEEKCTTAVGAAGFCGVGAGEWITFRAMTTLNLLDALNTGLLKVGLHIRSIDPTGQSDSYIVGNPVPLPAAAWLFGSALLGFMGFSVRRRV